jgi:hypothetical protein
MVGGFAVFGLIETHIFGFGINPETHGRLDDSDYDQRGDPRPHESESDSFKLNQELGAHAFDPESTEGGGAEYSE